MIGNPAGEPRASLPAQGDAAALTGPARPRAPGWLQRFVLPGLAFKAVVIGGGYSTGRELAEYFMPSGPWGGLSGMLLAMLIWSVISCLTFLFARATGAGDYRTFFRKLLGPAAVLFDAAY